MSSRQQEKEKRKEERLARERADAARIKRLRLMQMAVGGLLAAAAIAAVALAVTKSGGGSSGATPKGSATGVAIPKQQIADLAAATKAAKCAVHTYPIEGRNHVTGQVKYKTNPPTSGNHNPTPSLDGVYDPGNTPAKENYVHTLEHGRVEIQYAPGTTRHRIAQLETLQAEELNGIPGYKTLLFQNNTNMKYAVAATTWGHLIGCSKFNDRVFDALRAFRKQYVDKAPESSAQPPNNVG
ncbi:MAG: hypothetical protein QOI98_2824 [Solirubrobacteraceae bacterium]|nr:hypothetical protein [Solirubrobacteraceae bacterium]